METEKEVIESFPKYCENKFSYKFTREMFSFNCGSFLQTIQMFHKSVITKENKNNKMY